MGTSSLRIGIIGAGILRALTCLWSTRSADARPAYALKLGETRHYYHCYYRLVTLDCDILCNG